jgi:hypothetical protein
MLSAGFDAKQKLLALSALFVILGSGLWIYRTEFGPPNINIPLHQAVGEVMAEETSRLVGHAGSVVIVTTDSPQARELKIQVEAFQKQLKRLGGITVKETVTLDPGDNPKYRAGAGLSGKRFLKIVRKNPGASAIVSFVGAPQLSDAEIAQLKSTPKFIAETHSPEKLMSLFQKKILSAAIVPRYEFPAPGPRKPHTGREWFEHYFQILASETGVPNQTELP